MKQPRIGPRKRPYRPKIETQALARLRRMISAEVTLPTKRKADIFALLKVWADKENGRVDLIKLALGQLIDVLERYRNSDHSYDLGPSTEGLNVLDAWERFSALIGFQR